MSSFYNEARERRTLVFEDTRKQHEADSALRRAVAESLKAQTSIVEHSSLNECLLKYEDLLAMIAIAAEKESSWKAKHMIGERYSQFRYSYNKEINKKIGRLK